MGLMNFKKIMLAGGLVLGVNYLYADVTIINKHINNSALSNDGKLNLNKNINILTLNNAVMDLGEADNLSNLILKKLEQGKLAIKKDISLNLCGNATYVLSVGINEYQLDKLRYAVSDAKIVPLKIERSCENTQTTLLLDKESTKENILSRIEDISKKSKKDDTVIIYFSGYDMTIDNNKVVMPVDIISKNDIQKYNIPLDAISRYFEHTQAEVYILADTNFCSISTILTR